MLKNCSVYYLERRHTPIDAGTESVKYGSIALPTLKSIGIASHSAPIQHPYLRTFVTLDVSIISMTSYSQSFLHLRYCTSATFVSIDQTMLSEEK